MTSSRAKTGIIREAAPYFRLKDPKGIAANKSIVSRAGAIYGVIVANAARSFSSKGQRIQYFGSARKHGTGQL